MSNSSHSSLDESLDASLSIGTHGQHTIGSAPTVTISHRITNQIVVQPIHTTQPSSSHSHQREPLLLNGGNNSSPTLRHQHRAALAFVSGKQQNGHTNGVLNTSDGGEFEVSYAIDNPHYEINRGTAVNGVGALNGNVSVPSLNDYGSVSPTSFVSDSSDTFGRSPQLGPFITGAGLLGTSDSMRLNGAGGGLLNGRSNTMGEQDESAYKVYPQRFWVVVVFCLLAFNQSLIWITYSPISDHTETYYNISESQVDLLLNWGPIINLPLMGFTILLSRTNRGMRNLVLATAWVGLAAGILRLVPVWIPAWQNHSIYFLHLAQILNAATGPSLQATVTRISCIWMAARERTVATGFLFVSNNLGQTLGFVIGPGLVKVPDDIPKYLYLQAAFSILAFLMTILYFPAAPPTVPSAAAEQMLLQELQQAAEAEAKAAASKAKVTIGGRKRGLSKAAASGALNRDASPSTVSSVHANGNGGGLQQSYSVESSISSSDGATHVHGVGVHSSHMLGVSDPGGFFSSIRLALSNRSFVLLALSSGLLQGVFNCWTGVLSTVLPTLDDKTTGYFSFAGSLAGVVAGVVMGPVTRRPGWNRRLKQLILGLTASGIVFAAWFLMSTQSIFLSSGPIIPGSNVYLMGVAITILGFLVGATCPLAFEFAAELTFPISESISGGGIAVVNNAFSLMFLFVAPLVAGSVMTAMMFGASIACSLLLVPISDDYARMDAEARAAAADAAAAGEGLGDGTSIGHRRISDEDDFSPSGLSSSRRRSLLETHQDAMHREFARVMKEVDEGLNEPLVEPDQSSITSIRDVQKAHNIRL